MRCDDEHPVRAAFGRRARARDCRARGFGARPDQQHAVTPDFPARSLDQCIALGVVEQRGFTRGTCDDYAAHPGIEMRSHVVSEGIERDVAIVAERRYDRSD